MLVMVKTGTIERKRFRPEYFNSQLENYVDRSLGYLHFFG